MIRHGKFALSTFLFAMLSGCSQADPKLTATAPGDLQPVDSSSNPAEPRSLDEHYSALADSIPGFAGLRVNAAGSHTVVMLTDLAQSARAQQVIPPYCRRYKIGQDRPLEFQYVKYSWKQLEGWAAEIEPERPPLGTPALRAFDIDEANNSLFYGVADEETARKLTEAVKMLRVPNDAYIVRVHLPPRTSD